MYIWALEEWGELASQKDLKPTIPCSQGRAFSAYIFL